MMPNILLVENNGVQIEMKSFFGGHALWSFFGQVWRNLGKNLSHPQNFACSYTYSRKY